MSERSVPPHPVARRYRALSVAAAIAILIVLAGVYGMEHLRSNPAASACEPAVKVAARIAPLVHGEIAALAVAHTPFRVPDLSFKDAEGRERTLADWRGRTILLNL